MSLVRSARRPAGSRARSDLLLAVDAGNSNVVVGVFDGLRLVAHHRLSSLTHRTEDELLLLLADLLGRTGLPAAGGRMVLCSVVPDLTAHLVRAGQRLFRRPALVVTHELRLGLRYKVLDPSTLGADRITNMVAAHEIYGGPAIVVDLGTATTFDVVTARGVVLGGVIAPGVQSSAEELFRRASRLARVELRRPPRAIGRNTEENIQAGVVFGAVGQVDGIVGRLRREMGGRPRVIATGGLAELVARDSRTIQVVDPHLTLKGLKLIDAGLRRR
ncbi:MAG TPA: type III pantothenate kinase [Candidatus Saccharimonadales bacterium]|nr:type III pantothenate kinase [Candidatus Saccharimonadales bacterium]